MDTSSVITHAPISPAQPSASTPPIPAAKAVPTPNMDNRQQAPHIRVSEYQPLSAMPPPITREQIRQFNDMNNQLLKLLKDYIKTIIEENHVERLLKKLTVILLESLQIWMLYYSEIPYLK